VSPLPAGTPEHLHLAINEVGEVILDPKGRHLSDPVLSKPGWGAPAACSNPSCAKRESKHNTGSSFSQRAQPWQTSANQSTAPGAYPIVMPMSWLHRGQLPGRQEGYDGRHGAPRPDGVQAEALEIYRTAAPANASVHEVQEPCGAAVPGGRCTASSPSATRKSGGSGAPGAATCKQQDETSRKHAANKTDPTADSQKNGLAGLSAPCAAMQAEKSVGCLLTSSLRRVDCCTPRASPWTDRSDKRRPCAQDDVEVLPSGVHAGSKTSNGMVPGRPCAREVK